MNPDEIKKREDEKAKKALEESEESTTVAKRKGVKIFIYGQHFLKFDVNFHKIYHNIEYQSEVHSCFHWSFKGSVRNLQEFKKNSM